MFSDQLRNKLPFIFLTALTVLIWYKIIGQGLFGEGYFYFDRGQDFVYQNRSTANPLVVHDAFARVVFDILPPLFGDKIWLYLVFQIAVMVAINLSFYYVLLLITKSRWISFTAAVFFLGSYVGLFEMLATGNYQRFAQRVPQLIPLLFAFLNLHIYLQKKRANNFLFAFLLFGLALLMGHFATFMLPLFILYPLIWSTSQKKKMKSLALAIKIAAAFTFLNFIIINQSIHFPRQAPLDFLKNRQDLTSGILLQLANINLPVFIIEKIASAVGTSPGAFIVPALPIVVFYLWGLVAARKHKPELALLYTTSLLIIPALLLLNLYTGKVDAAHNIRGFRYYFLPSYFFEQTDLLFSMKGDRYYFVPLLFFSILWSVLLWMLLSKKPKIYKILTILLLSLYLFYNTQLIWTRLGELKPASDATKSYLAYIKSISPNFQEGSIVVVPRFFLWPSTMIRVFYGYPDMQFLELRSGWEEDIAAEKRDRTFIINYNYTDNQIIDLTQKFRAGEKLP